MFNANRQFFYITLSMLLMTSLFLIGCSESEDSLLVEEPIVEEPVIEPIVEEPVVEEPVIEPIVEEPVVENNFCSVGDVLQPGESCIDGTGEVFTVLEDGRGRYLFFNVGEGIRLFGNINGKVRTFSAEKQDDGTWKILSVTPKQ